ncbi:hypothetical protein BDE02_04G056800 [Populus trichocarpa]|nr:hypothetical protein BDE02_04G056800 [Populus trichocarpa]KAI5591115.1 hypothetical protein BDE02_04G056800 [Populus trichocarpa]
MLEAIACTGKARSLVLFHLINWLSLSKVWKCMLFCHLQADVEGYELKPVALSTSRELHVDQSCFAIGNPYEY